MLTVLTQLRMQTTTINVNDICAALGNWDVVRLRIVAEFVFHM